MRHFAKWAYIQKENLFTADLPTRGIKQLHIEEPGAKSLSNREINRIFKAADRLVATDNRKNSRPRRNRAILALLYYTGLRVSELCNLDREQYTGKHLLNVRRKGISRTRKMYVSKDCRGYLDDYVSTEWKIDAQGEENAPLILSTKSRSLTRVTIWKVLERLSREASKHTKDNIRIHPHQLRHTFGLEVRKRTGSDTETAALLGHSGLAYVGRYVRKTDEEREKILDDL